MANLYDDTFTTEMAAKTMKDFSGRSRTNIVPRVANRINRIERRVNELKSTISSQKDMTQNGSLKRRKSKQSNVGNKQINYAEIKKWN